MGKHFISLPQFLWQDTTQKNYRAAALELLPSKHHFQNTGMAMNDLPVTEFIFSVLQHIYFQVCFLMRVIFSIMLITIF